MHPDLRGRRRVLVESYQRFLIADREWVVAVRQARAWMPGEISPKQGVMGNPGSKVRRLYEQRDRAVRRLQLVREALGRARLRVGDGQGGTGHVRRMISQR